MQTATKEQISEWLSDKTHDNMMKIITQYHYFVKGKVGKLCRLYNCINNYEDFMQDAQIPLIKTYWDYDKSKGADFTTILSIRIEGYIQQMFNDNYKLIATTKHLHKNKSITNMSILMNDYYNIYDDFVMNKAEDYKDKHSVVSIRQSLKKILTPRQYLIIALSWGFGGRVKQSKESVAKILSSNRKAITKELEVINNKIMMNKNLFKGEI